MSIKISSRKAKGRSLQKFVCQRIANIFNIKYDQQDDNCEIHSREMGQKGCDIILRGELRKKFLFDLECKNTERVELYKSIEQAKANTGEDRFWGVVHKKNYSDPIIIMDFETFEYLIKKGIDNGTNN